MMEIIPVENRPRGCTCEAPQAWTANGANVEMHDSDCPTVQRRGRR